MKFFELIGNYFMLMRKVFSKPEKWRVYRRRILDEMIALGLNSVIIVMIVSIFMGAVVALQLAINFESPFIPRELIGFATREVMILEFSSAIVALILAGKVGSNIASEIGTMRITDQIDALEMMGVNSASYLIMPKIAGAVLFFPLLNILSIVIGVFGGFLIVWLTGIMIPDTFVAGLKLYFKASSIGYAIVKTAVFAFIITSVGGFYGYYARDNSLEVGRSSTKAVVVSCVLILMFDLILTQLFYI